MLVHLRSILSQFRSSGFCAAALCGLALCAPVLGQGSGPVVTVAPISEIVVPRGGKAPLEIALRVNRGFHVNSHQPNDELLLPTVVHLDPPEGITIMNVAYPEDRGAGAFFRKQKTQRLLGNLCRHGRCARTQIVHAWHTASARPGALPGLR